MFRQLLILLSIAAARAADPNRSRLVSAAWFDSL